MRQQVRVLVPVVNKSKQSASQVLRAARAQLGPGPFVLTDYRRAIVNSTLQSQYGLEWLMPMGAAAADDAAALRRQFVVHDAISVHVRLPSVFELETTFAVPSNARASRLLDYLHFDRREFLVAAELDAANIELFASVLPMHTIASETTYVLAPPALAHDSAVGGAVRKPPRKRSTPRKRTKSGRKRTKSGRKRSSTPRKRSSTPRKRSHVARK